jgi:hypothetical protein
MAQEILFTLIPFFFVLSVVYGALEVSKTFKNKGVMVIISLVLATVSILNESVVALLNQIMPYGVILFIVVFFLSFVGNLFRGRGSDIQLIVIVCALILIFIAQQGYGIISDLLPSGVITAQDFTVAVGVVLIIFILYGAYKWKG